MRWKIGLFTPLCWGRCFWEKEYKRLASGHGRQTFLYSDGEKGQDKIFAIPKSFVYQDCTLNRAAPNYKNSHPFVITLRIPLYPDRTLRERIKRLRLEQGLLQRDLAKRVGVSETTIINWEKGRTNPAKKNLEGLQKFLGIESISYPSNSYLKPQRRVRFPPPPPICKRKALII